MFLFIPWFRWEAWTFEVPLAGEVSLQPFAMLIWLGLFVGLVTALVFAKTHERSVPQTLSMALYLVLFAFPISYVLNAAFYLPETFRNLIRYPSELFGAQLGWSMFGGIIGGIIGAWVWKLRTGGPMLRIGEPHVFALPFGWVFARLGCFVTHDHPGRVTDFFLAVEDFRVGVPPYQPRHDLGLYDVFVIATIALTFAILSRKSRPVGFYVALLPILYTPCRFMLDFLRAPVSEGGDIRYAGLTPGQYIAAILFVVGVVLWRRIRRDSNTRNGVP